MKTTILSPADLESARRLIAAFIANEDNGQHEANIQLNREIYKLTERVGFEEMALLLPEQERPELISLELPISTFQDGHLIYLVRPSLVPECAFIAQMHTGTGCSRKSVRIGEYSFMKKRSLTCFCDLSMNPESELGECINVITELCSKHGITHVIGRKVDHQGVVRFTDTEQFEEMARRECNPAQVKKLERFVWAE